MIKRKNYGEQDRIVTVFTKDHGKLRVMAKGVRKVPSRRAGHIEVFTYATFTLFKGKTFDYVQEVCSISSFPKIVANLKKVSFAYYLSELTDRLLPDNQEAVEVFELFYSSLQAIETNGTETEYHEVVYRFALDLLWVLGYLPRNQTISFSAIQSHIESIIERKLTTPKLLEMTS